LSPWPWNDKVDMMCLSRFQFTMFVAKILAVAVFLFLDITPTEARGKIPV